MRKQKNRKRRARNRKGKQEGSLMENKEHRRVTDLNRPDLRGRNLTETEYNNYVDYSDNLTKSGQTLYRQYKKNDAETFNHPEVMKALLSIDDGKYAYDSDDPFKKSEGGVIREGKQEGSLMVPPELETSRETRQEGDMIEEPMAMPPEMGEVPMKESIEAPVSEVPVDTYPNATPEELEGAQESDEEMEEGYMEFVLNESLDPEEQQYLMQTLEGDPQLSMIFDKVVETASEFSGSGEVQGPGDSISDSIPARLSDGEFVMTQKATEQLGPDNLQTLMDEAERAYDGGMMREGRYLGGVFQDDEEELGQGKSTDDDIRKLMSIKANKTPSLR